MASSDTRLESQIFSDITDDSFGSPLSFNRIGRSKLFFQWTQEQHTQFLEWWLSTEWVINAAADQDGADDLATRVNWNSTSRKSEFWKSFDQAANRHTGEPVLICQKCGISIVHPGIRNSGTNALKNHVLSQSCRQIFQVRNNREGEHQASRYSIFEKPVSPD
jgi:hypothetical protein